MALQKVKYTVTFTSTIDTDDYPNEDYDEEAVEGADSEEFLSVDAAVAQSVEDFNDGTASLAEAVDDEECTVTVEKID